MSELHGLLLLDKPKGLSSHDLVAKTRRIFGTKSVGHCGTLDPLATGLMILLLNEATKLSQFILEKDKRYIVDLDWGKTSDSFDSTGEILSETPERPTEAAVVEAIQGLSGLQNLPVPSFSAIKVGGEKLYEKARRGEDFIPPTREMNFYSTRVLEQSSNHLKVDIECSKGTYIRSWVHTIGQRLGCGAIMTDLRRTSSQPYRLQDAISLEKLTEIGPKKDLLGSAFVPVEGAIPEFKLIRVKGADEVMLGNGLISYDLRSRLIQVFNPDLDRGIRIFSGETSRLLAIIGLEPGKGFVIRRILKY
jgi:tRNA pseudouridine55 synthase